MKLLFDKGADITFANNDVCTGGKWVVKLLLQKRAYITIASDEGCTFNVVDGNIQEPC